MTKDESLEITGHIASVIAQYAPGISYTAEELQNARETYSEKKLKELEQEGFYFGDFELFFVMLRFLSGMDLWNRADEKYLKKLFASAKKMDATQFQKNPYLSCVKIREQKQGNILLTNSFYKKGEFFQYDMPSLRDEIVVPKIGFFTKKVSFPAVYEGNTPWVSVCPSEIFSMEPDVNAAYGNTLVLGLGLGYYPFRISFSEKVKSITIVEKNPDIISLFQKEILPQFPHREKIRVVEEDAFDFLKKTSPGKFNFCYADIWEGWEDGAKAYQKIEKEEIRLKGTDFRYWIKDEILWYLENA